MDTPSEERTLRLAKAYGSLYSTVETAVRLMRANEMKMGIDTIEACCLLDFGLRHSEEMLGGRQQRSSRERQCQAMYPL